jgi:hypothetical protein
MKRYQGFSLDVLVFKAKHFLEKQNQNDSLSFGYCCKEKHKDNKNSRHENFKNRSEFHQLNLKGPKQKYNKIGIEKRFSTTNNKNFSY